MVVKAVVFDFGGVIMKYTKVTDLFLDISQQLEITLEHFMEKRNIILKTVELSEDLMTGKLSAQQFEDNVFLPAVNAAFGLTRTEPVRALGKWTAKETMVYNQCVLDTITLLREKGITTGLLTNNFFIDKELPPASTPIDRQLFDAVVESCLEGVQKPDRKIYEISHSRVLLAAPGIDKNEVVFLDDVAINCESAREFGWRALHVDTANPQIAIDELTRMLAEENGF